MAIEPAASTGTSAGCNAAPSSRSDGSRTRQRLVSQLRLSRRVHPVGSPTQERIEGDSPPTLGHDSLFVLGAVIEMREDAQTTTFSHLPAYCIAKSGLRTDIAISTNSCGLCRLARLTSLSDVGVGPPLATVSRATSLDVPGVGFGCGGVEITRATTVCHLQIWHRHRRRCEQHQDSLTCGRADRFERGQFLRALPRPRETLPESRTNTSMDTSLANALPLS